MPKYQNDDVTTCQDCQMVCLQNAPLSNCQAYKTPSSKNSSLMY